MILIGSRALVFRNPNILGRLPKDFDFMATEEEALNWLEKQNITDITRENGKIISRQNMCEFEIIESGKSNEMFRDIVENDPQTLKTDFGLIPNFNLLFTLKCSHKYKKSSPHFWKNCRDYHIMKAAGAKILPEYQEFFKLREKETYDYKHPKLNVKKEDFFKGDQVEYIYDHDSIHQAVKLTSQPAYRYYMKEGSEVFSDKIKFFDCSEEIRLCSALEESAVLALERSLIPHPNKLTPEQAFQFALSKVCSSITSGWYREYCYENAFTVLRMSKNYKYFDMFQDGLKKGIVIKL